MAELRLNGEMNLLSTRYRVSSDCACRFKRQKWMVEVLRETSSDIGRIGLTGHERELLVIEAEHATLGRRWLCCADASALLFTENDSNRWRLYGTPNETPFVKDGLNDYLVHGNHEAVNPAQVGTKTAAHYDLTLDPGE